MWIMWLGVALNSEFFESTQSADLMISTNSSWMVQIFKN